MSKEQKLTPWFHESVMPVRLGVYELGTGVNWRCFAYWNGQRFGYRTWTPIHDIGAWGMAAADAFKFRKQETCLPPLSPWRGLAEPPQ